MLETEGTMASTVAAQETPRRDRTTELIKVRYVTNSSTGMHVTVWLEPRTPHQEGAPAGTGWPAAGITHQGSPGARAPGLSPGLTFSARSQGQTLGFLQDGRPYLLAGVTQV